MCKGSFDFLRDVAPKPLITNLTTGAANVETLIPRNPKRYGFVIASGGGAINYRPTLFGSGVNFGIYAPGAANTPGVLTIEHFAQLIFEPWTFTLVTAGNTYTIFELELGGMQR